jgi:hypothetical protein
MRKIYLFFTLFISINIYSQDLSTQLSTVAGQYAQSYLQPFIDVYGAGMNSGFFHSASIYSNSDSKLSISFSIKSMGSLVLSTEKYFSAVYNTTTAIDTLGQVYTVNAKATVKNAPTIFGNKTKGTVTTDMNDTIVVGGILYYPIHETKMYSTFGGLVSTDIAPLLVPQLDIGTVLGTQMFLRWIPPVKIGNYGTTNFFGVGVRHNFSQYILAIPFNIAAGFYYQNFTMDDTTGKQFISVSALAANLQISKSLGFFEIYGALQYESSSLDVNYQYIPSTNSGKSSDYHVNVNFNIKGKNSYRILAGVSYSIGGFFLNTDVNFASISTFTFGIGYNIL